MDDLILRQADIKDLDILTEMNQELIKDEGSENPMTYDELYKRMSEFLNNDWKATLLIINETVIGYALYQERSDLNYQTEEIYIRQYFIRRNFRKRGLGKQGIESLRREVFSPKSTLLIDVLEVNTQGRAFWESIGFKAYYTNMKLKDIE